MNKVVLFLLAFALVCACSRTEPAAKAIDSQAEAKPVDYIKICEHLIPLAPESRKETFTKKCVASYQAYLPACRNAEAVNHCFSSLKSWDGRLACLDSCEADPARGK
jgi:hypothetical protein